MKTVGVIGGLGPETTSEFYLELIFSSKKLNNESYPPVLIYSVPLPYFVEEEAIVKGVGTEQCLPILIKAAQKLEKGEADFLVLPCNSLHLFIDDIKKAVKIPVLSILEETSKFLQEKQIKQVGIISTTITQKNQLYEKALGTSGIGVVLPDDFQQAKIGKMIHNLVSNRQSNKDREELINIVNDFEKRGVENVILACSDLQLLIPQHSNLKIYDTMKILADATIKKILEK